MRLLSLAALAAAVANANRQEAKNAAIDKVVQMLQEMETRGKNEKQEEEVSFAKFSTWCSDTKANKESDKEASLLAIDQFKAQVEQAQAKISAASEAIAAAVSVQEKMKADIAVMGKVRAEQNAAYLVEKQDLNDSIYASNKAIEVLSSVEAHVPVAAESFVQIQKSLKGKGKHSRTLLELVQALQDPFQSASQRQSDTVIKMIEKLKEEFEQQLQDANKGESNALHAYEMKKQESEQKAANNALIEEEQKELKGEQELAEGEASKSLEREQKDLKQTKKDLSELNADCTQKAKDFKARMASRADELSAIGQAISILQSDEIGKGAGHLDKAQTVGSFLQVRSFLAADPQQAVAQFLRTRGNALHSKMLVQIAAMAAADPFVKVRKMIQELINRLQEEAKAELTKKGKCDKDMAESDAKIKEFTGKVKKLTAEVEKLTAQSGKAKAHIKKLKAELAQTKKDLAEARQQRAERKAENNKSISETEAAVKAVTEAMTVLEGYYSKVSLLQQPEYEGGEYTGMGNGGVMGLLEVIKSQMETVVRETKSAEDKDASAHADFTKESEQSIAVKQTSLRSTKEDKANYDEKLQNAKDALDGEDGAKQMLEEYTKERNEVIDPMCVAKGVSFEERNKKREEEIKSLEEALEILSQTEV